MSELLDQLAVCVERGKVNAASPFPPDLKGQDGADEITKQLLDQDVAPEAILNDALIVGMSKIGAKFRANEVFVPEVLMAAKAMGAAMEHLKPHFDSGKIKRKGKFIIGTVSGDLHDIGKNLVSMMVEGGGFEVIDLGVDVSTEKFISSIEEHPGAFLGMSSLLTTTMANMEASVKAVKEKHPDQKICIGGAPVTQEFAEQIGADSYSDDPQGVLEYLNAQAAS